MSYIFKGRLCGYICEECHEPISRAKVRLYRVGRDRNVTALAAAAAKDTFAILDEDQVKQKESLLLAETETDDEGNFAFELGEKQKYGGEAFEIDVYCGNVPPHLPPRHEPKPVQFSVTVLQPLWRERGNDLVYGWEYCLPWRFWCPIRARFGVWVICGHVTVCEKERDTGTPVPNVRVRAFDVDLVQDDEFGSAVTDLSGHFRIYYTPADFRVTPWSPWVNFEWVGGPDVYFQIETLLGTPLLTEPRSKGRTALRENRGPCTCVHLCIDRDKVPPVTDETLSIFDHIGAVNYVTQVDSGAAGDGKTLAGDQAFYSTLRLNGVMSKTKNGNPLEYAFEVAAYDPVSDVLGPYTQVPMAQIAPTQIGTWEHFTGAFPVPVETKAYILNGVAGPGVLVPQVTADGWVQMPQESNVFDANGAFTPGQGPYPGFIILRSELLRAFGSIDESAVDAGETAGPPNATLGRVFYYSLRMKVREANGFGGPTVAGSEQLAGTCVRLAVMNTHYDNVAKNGSWIPHRVPDQLCVASLDIAELAGGGCTEITTALTVKYTAAHPNLGGFSIRMHGPGEPSGGYTFTPGSGGTPENRFDTATNDFNIADLPDCAYIVRLSVDLLLTTGDGGPQPVIDELAFCKNAN